MVFFLKRSKKCLSKWLRAENASKKTGKNNTNFLLTILCALRTSSKKSCMDIKLVLGSWRYMPLFYLSSARPRVQQTVIKNTLKETGEPALHRSESQQPTAHLSASQSSSAAFSAALQNDSLLQELTTVVVSSFLVQILMHLSISDPQFNSLLLSAFSLSFEQVVSVPVHT